MLRWFALVAVMLIALVAGSIVVLGKRERKVVPVPHPTAFYTAPSPLPKGPPGTIVRRQRLAGLPRGERGWRILYISHGYDGKRAAVSGLVVIPTGAIPAHHRHIVAFAHGTSGVAPRCGPSVLGAAGAKQIDGLRHFIQAGDAVVAPDYQGLGTPGPNPYLVAKATARTVIDAVRAVRKIHAVHAGRRYVVFGASQGAQAAIAVGQLAPQYGRGLQLAGIAAAGAPISLPSLFTHAAGTPLGNVIAAYTLSTWAAVYDREKLNAVVTPAAQRAVRAIDGYCLATQAVPKALTRQVSFTHAHPTRTKAWSGLLRKNSLRPFTTDVPMLITQAGSDEIVQRAVTTHFIRALCERADTVDYRLYPHVSHQAIGPSSAGFTTGWISGRFADRGAPSSCPS